MDTCGTRLISHLDRHVASGPVGAEGAPGRWRAVPYRADGFDGVLLGCGCVTEPEPVTLRLDADGPHRVWLGLYAPFAKGTVRARLTGDLCCQTFTTPDYPTIDPPIIHEIPWKETDLTGQNLVLEGAYYRGSPLSGALAFVRLEPIETVSVRTRPEVWRPLALTNDGSGVFRRFPHRRPEDLLEQFESFPDESCARILLWGNGDADSCNYPTKVGGPLFRDWPDMFPSDVARVAIPNFQLWQSRGWDSLKLVRDYTRRRGWELHVYIRMEAFADAYPLEELLWSEFFYAHPEWWCLDREGNQVNRMSYAYPGVQDHMLDLIREILSYEPDGLCLCLIRGIPVVLYEPIMVEGFRKRHGEDPRRLDELDPRWLDYQAGVFTAFVTRVKETMGQGRRLSAMVPGRAADLRRWGLDAATWVREGIIDDLYPVGQRFNAANTHYDAAEALEYDYFQSLDGRDRIRLIPCLYAWKLYHDDIKAWRALMRSFLDRGADGYCVWDAATADESLSGTGMSHEKMGDIGYRDWPGQDPAPNASSRRTVKVLELNGFRIDYYGTHEVD